MSCSYDGAVPSVRSLRRRVAFECVGPSCTKQAFADECDINQIMLRFQRTGVISHVNTRTGEFMDVSNVLDYREALESVRKAEELFMGLPAKVRGRFDNDAGAYLAFLQDPKNQTEEVLLEMLGRPVPPKVEPKGSGEAPESKPEAKTG